MDLIEIILLAIGLAMDAFSVSIYKGVKEGKLNIGLCTTLGVTFGFMQGFMPLMAYFLTSIEFLRIFIQSYSKYIIFLLLIFIGGKMLIDGIKETFENKNNQKTEDEAPVESKKGLCFSKEIFVLGIATSIDAMSIGITFTGSKMTTGEVFVASGIIALTSFIFSFVGCMFGKVLSKYIKNYAGIFGGVVLITIGIKVLLGL